MLLLSVKPASCSVYPNPPLHRIAAPDDDMGSIRRDTFAACEMLILLDESLIQLLSLLSRFPFFSISQKRGFELPIHLHLVKPRRPPISPLDQKDEKILAQHPHYRVSTTPDSCGKCFELIMYSFCSTPGTGKTTHAAQVVEQLQSNPSTSGASWQHVNVGDFVKDKGCHSGYNEEWQSWDVDEDKVSLVPPRSSSLACCRLRARSIPLV
jgi:hypothetical protein